MKAYLFIENRGLRCPKPGEWYVGLDDNEMLICEREFETERIVVSRHAIEIPDHAISMRVESHVLGPFNDVCIGNFKHIHLTRPKKKVKKTVFLVVNQHDGRIVYSVHDKGSFPLMENSYPIEIEVEE